MYNGFSTASLACFKILAVALNKLLRVADPLPEDDADDNYGIKMHGQYISRLLFADDVVLIDKSGADASKRATKIAEVCRKAGLLFNTTKSKVMRNDSADTRPVRVEKDVLEDVDHMKYLGRVFKKDGSLDFEVNNRIRAAWASYHGIGDALNKVSVPKKNSILRTSVLAAALYGCETWNTKVEDIRRIQRSIDYIWRNAKAGPPPNVENRIMRSKVKWAGHIVRMHQDRICRIITLWELPNKYPRKPGRPKKRWVDDVKSIVKAHNHNRNLLGLGGDRRKRIGIISSNVPWSRMAQDRLSWRCLVHSYDE